MRVTQTSALFRPSSASSRSSHCNERVRGGSGFGGGPASAPASAAPASDDPPSEADASEPESDPPPSLLASFGIPASNVVLASLGTYFVVDEHVASYESARPGFPIMPACPTDPVTK